MKAEMILSGKQTLMKLLFINAVKTNINSIIELLITNIGIIITIYDIKFTLFLFFIQKYHTFAEKNFKRNFHVY